jgi:opine dehydrogenase
METGMHIGIVGTGGIGLGSAAWLASTGHQVTLWSPRGGGAEALRDRPLEATGVLNATVRVAVADSAATLCATTSVVLIAVPVNGHRQVMDALLPHLRDGHMVVVSSVGSLSSLYLYEQARAQGLSVTVASMGTTTLTARRTGDHAVRVMTRRTELGVSALPNTHIDQVLETCRHLFGEVFKQDTNALASALTNINPVAHGPLALFNWTRIERGENWPQYHYMTPQASAVIEQLDAERRQLAQAFGLQVRSIEEHFAKSFGTRSAKLADIAAELHQQRGGPPGPTDTSTRFLSEDVPYGLVFCKALGAVAGVAMPATETIINVASLVTGQDLVAANDLLDPLGVMGASVDSLVRRVG